ncbi:hypothetical protein ACFJGX_21640 [Hydrogenophaga sp. UC242_50]|uniref:hypothetical protein n=1 Tax=unclassified Hydrogenophaga TaxID=2610897 RepID=UPI0036D3CFB8
MSNEKIIDVFTRSADSWICDDYNIDIRYLANADAQGACLLDAHITLNPLPGKRGFGFHFEGAGHFLGHLQPGRLKKKALTEILSDAVRGRVSLSGRSMQLAVDRSLDYYSEMMNRDRWFSDLHLQVSGTGLSSPSSIDMVEVDNKLRASTPPFDGLSDALAWLGLRSPEATSRQPAIAVRVGPPVDLIFDQCVLSQDRLKLTLHAHPRFDVGRVGLALRSVPDVALSGRIQVAQKIKWARVRGGVRTGVLDLEVKQTDSVLAMLMIEEATVRRQWFVDPARARNNRLLATQHFDRELRMLRQALFESTDPTRFENGVASLLFLFGFSPAVQLETDAPDVIVTTPLGRLVIVECTTRVSDFGTKLGKLVDRRGALSKHLAATGHSAEVSAVLVCRLPRDQIAAHEADLRSRQVLLVSGDELRRGIDSARTPSDPDEMLQKAFSRLTVTSSSELNGQRH